MEQVLAQVFKRLSAPALPNEAAVRQSLVLPVLRGVGWDTEDFEQVSPEYTVQGTRVDLALCHPRSKPQVFVEIKQSSSFEQGVDQLLAYAFKQGVRIAVLTDGQRWSFYLPSGEGSFGDRRFHHLDLLHRPLGEVQARLIRYLARARVESGEAFHDARSDCEQALRQKQLIEALPGAWAALLRDGDEYISFALAERVEQTTGIRPSPEAVEEFLSTMASRPQDVMRAARQPTIGVADRERPINDAPKGAPADRFWFRIDAAPVQSRKTAIALVRDCLVALEAIRPGFLSRYESEARHGRTRRWISTDRTHLYDGRPDLCEEYAEPLGDGWWLGTNYSNGEKRKMLEDVKKSASAMGLRFDFGVGGGG